MKKTKDKRQKTKIVILNHGLNPFQDLEIAYRKVRSADAETTLKQVQRKVRHDGSVFFGMTD